MQSAMIRFAEALREVRGDYHDVEITDYYG
jgi:hypothetical protein